MDNMKLLSLIKETKLLGLLLRVSGLTRLNFLLEELGTIASKTTQVIGCVACLLFAGLMSAKKLIGCPFSILELHTFFLFVCSLQPCSVKLG